MKLSASKALGLAALATAGAWAWHRLFAEPGDVFRGETALVTGGSRGLGLLIARELAAAGCRVAICARDPAELDKAAAMLKQAGGDVIAIPCDITDREQVLRLVAEVQRRLGPVGILVNNAGIIQVAPVSEFGVADFEKAMATMFWGTLYPALAVLPGMRGRKSGHIINVTSVAGMVSVPHLAPYNAAKSAAFGLSQTLHAELAQSGVKVTTVVPWLMRTGSYIQAQFGGQKEREFTLFAVMGSLPGLSLDAKTAARRIVRGAAMGRPVQIVGWPAQIAVRVHGLFPGLTAAAAAQVSRFLPKAPAPSGKAPVTRGEDFAVRKRDESWFRLFTGLNAEAARRFQYVDLDLQTPRG